MLNFKPMLTGKDILAVIITALLFFIIPFEVKAQKDDFRDKIEKIKLEKLIKKLDLDENNAMVFTEKYKSFSIRIKDLNKKRFIAYKLMVENIESGTGLDTLVSQVISYEDEINSERISFAEEMKAMLTPKQLATMIIFERKFTNEIRKLLKDFKKENRRSKE